MRHRVLAFLLSLCSLAGNVPPAEAATTITAGPAFVKVSTLIASDPSHDLLKQPSGVAIDPRTGTVFVADTMHHRIVAVDPDGAETVIAGTGKPGQKDGAPASAQFKQPNAVALDPSRSVLYVADAGNDCIRRIAADGTVSTFAGSGHKGSADGAGLQASFNDPSAIALDASGNLIVADTGNHAVRSITPQGVVSTIAGDVHEGFADGAANKAQFKAPQGIAIGPDGTIYIGDTKNNVIRKLQNGVVTTIAGTGHAGFVDGAASLAEFREPQGIACDEAGTLYVADTKNHAIRVVANGSVSTVTGSNKAGFLDGTLSDALFKEPASIVFAGAVFVADSGNDAIRRIDAQVAIAAIDPHTGAAAGGTDVHVFGSGFVPGATQVSFGTTPATNVRYATSTGIVVTAPPVTGTVDVTVTTSGGTATLPHAYSTLPPPTVATVTPVKGRTAGGDTVTITGTNFTSDAIVRFNGVAATNVILVSSNALTATTPAGASGTAGVSVTTSAGAATKPAAFTYFPLPAITAFSPLQGAAGTVVTITGANFDADPAGDVVLFGNLPASVTSASAAQLVVIAPSGVVTSTIRVTTAGGSATSSVPFTVASYVSLEITAPVTSFTQGDSVPFNAIARSSDGSGVDVSAQATWTVSDANVASVNAGSVTGRVAGSAIITATLNGLTATKSVAIQPATIPVLVPSAVSRTVVQPLADATRFLYAGAGAVQTGVAPNAISDDRIATAGGTVHTREGAAIPGVEVTIAGHPELGHTYTRADGRYDLAFNGGGAVTLVYRKAAWLEAQRLVTTRWNDQAVADDVVLVPYDAKASVVTLNSATPQSARSNAVTDDDGTRATTFVFPAGENATVMLPDGTTLSPQSLHVRATEYTVGMTGPNAMPAPLPSMSAYTYCIELSADEALGGSVQFTKALSVYNENFLSLPVGTQVPVGWYDRAHQHWVASRNARVIRIVGITGGLATIDSNGDGAADDATTLAQLGFDDDERRTLASLYGAGQTLWRFRTNHFSTWDENLLARQGARPPATKKPQTKAGKTQAKCQLGGWSIIDCANQTLGESIPIQGTPWALEYDSSRAGRSQYSTEIELTGDDVPASMLRVDLRVTIAGQDHRYTFAPQPDLKYTFTWNGADGFGRPVQGARNANITISYVYPISYAAASQDPGWDVPASQILEAERRDASYALSESSNVFLGHFDVGNAGFGGWSFSPVRLYDGIGRAIYDAGGIDRGADPQQTHETAITNFIGGLVIGDPAAPDLFAMAAGPEGTIYYTDGYRIRKKMSDGTIAEVAGTSGGGFTPDGLPALGNPADPWQLATGPDGTLYVIEDTRVRAIVNGRWVTVAGNDRYEQGTQPEGVPATSRSVTAWSLTLGPDGALYIGSVGKIYKVDPDGIIHTIAGGGTNRNFADGDSAFSALFGTVGSLSIGPDGSVYFTDDAIVGKATVDGRVFRVLPQDDAREPHTVSVAADGTVLAGDIRAAKVYEIAPDGTLSTFAGTGGFERFIAAPAGMSRSVTVDYPQDVKVAPDGSVYIVDLSFETIRHADASFPRSRTASAVVIPSSDGSVIDRFESGRHVQTLHALTNAALETFTYDADGNVIAITDVDGLITHIERNGAGDPTAIIAPNGQQTTLSVTNGYLDSITEPAGASYQFTYGSNGLLASLKDRRGGLHEFTYDDDGLLTKDKDPAGGFISLTRSGIADTFNVSRVSAEGRTQTYATVVDASGSEMHTHVGQDGLATTSSFYGGQITVTSPTGSVSSTSTPDPRFGMLTPIASVSMTIGSKSVRATRTRSLTLSDPANVLSLTSVTDSIIINGHEWISTYNAATRREVMRSPVGRQVTATLDATGRPLVLQQPSLADVTLTWDSHGNLTSVTSGARLMTFSYDDLDRVTSVIDPLKRNVALAYDSANRVTGETLPGGRSILFTYDADGNVTSVTPLSRPSHNFTFTSINLREQYTLPAVSSGGLTKYSYNKDRQLTLVTRPDLQTIAFDYDDAGRLSKLITPTGFLTYGYDAAGRTASVTNSQGASLVYSWDGPLLTSQSWTGEVSGSVAFTYDSDLRLASENGVSFTYDNDGLLTSAGGLTVQRDAQTGLISSATLGNISDTSTYNAFGELMAYTASVGGSEALRASYTRDDAGRITQIVETTGGHSTTTAYTYDDAGRLATVTRDGQSAASYAYDINGNRQNGTYDDQDRLLSYGGAAYTYTANGELATKTDVSGLTTYTYDTLGNLRTVALPNGDRVDYVTDAHNRRVGKKINGTLTASWLYADQLRIVAELDGGGAVTKRFVYGARTNVPDYMLFGGVSYRIICDHLGSPRYVLEATSGSVVESLTYDEFGNTLSDSNPGFQPFGFAGGLVDRDTGLERLGARDYDPHIGRWTTKEPLGFSGGGTNFFEYAFSDPVNVIDVNGKNPALLVPGIVGAVAGALTVTGYQIYENVHHGRAWNACFNGSDIGIAAGVGFLAGITIPAVAPTVTGAVVIGAAANVTQTVLTNLAHPGEPLTGGSLAISAVVGAVSGPVGGSGSSGVLVHEFSLSMSDVLRNLGAAAASNFPTGDTAGCGCQ